MSSDVVTLGIVDNDPFARSMLCRLFRELHAPVNVLWDVGSGPQALELCDKVSTRPRAVVTDLSMPDMDGVQFSARLRESHPEIVVVAMTALAFEYTQEEMRSAGIVETFLKGCSGSDMVNAVGRAVGSQALSRWRWRKFAPSQLLTESEVEIMRLLAQGRTVSAIARQLSVSESTVKTRLRTIYAKLSAHSKAEAVALCVQEGVLD